MDWPYEDPDFSQNDFEEVFTYVPCASKTICQYVGDEEPREFTIQTDRDLKGWIEEVETQKSSPGLAVILAGRHHLSNNPANLQYLPFSREGFQNLVELLPLHGDTARHINRTDVPYFTDINLVHRGGAVYHICRTSAAWSGDMAVSSVFDPETGFTRGVVFGCSENTTTEFDGRIYNSETAWTHPMLLVAILVELERIRHFDLVKERVAQLLSQVRAMNKAETISSTSELAQDNYSVNHWILVSQLLIALEAWKVQLNKMDNHITDLEKTFFSDSPQPSRGASPEMSSDASSCKVSPASWKIHAKDTGRRIQKRLREILGEYDERIRECLMVLNGMALAAQLSWNQIGYQDTQANLKIATDTRKDSNQMRSIAFLTMIFLPATFLASLFSMTFFNWGASEGEHVVSPLLWIYFALAIGITLIVVGCWYLFTRTGRRPPSQDEEKGFGAGPRRAGTDMSWVTKDTGLLSSPSHTSKAPVGLDTKLQIPRPKAVDLSKAASSLRRLSRMLVFSGTKSNPKLRTGPLDGPFNTRGNFDTAYRQALAGGTNSRASTFATVPLPGYAVSRTHAITTPSPPFFDTKQSFNRDWGRAEKAITAEGNSSNKKGTNDGKTEFEKALPLPGKLSWKGWKGGTER